MDMARSLCGSRKRSHPFLPIHNYIGLLHSSRSNHSRTGSCKDMAHISCSPYNYHQVLADNMETTPRQVNYHILMAINTQVSTNQSVTSLILSSPNCVACPNVTKSIQHTLWDCPKTHQIWQGVGRLLQLCQVQGTINEGMYVGYHSRPHLTSTNIQRRGCRW